MALTAGEKQLWRFCGAWNEMVGNAGAITKISLGVCPADPRLKDELELITRVAARRLAAAQEWLDEAKARIE